MDAKHTPGAMRAAERITKAIDELVERCGGIIVNHEARKIATARLIDDETGAHQLLEALKQIREIGGFSGLDHLDSVAALIAKAEGKPPA